MELLKYKIRSVKYEITIFPNMLVVYHIVSSLCGGCIYKRVDVMAVHAQP